MRTHWWTVGLLALLILLAGLARRATANEPATLPLELQVKGQAHIIASLTQQWKSCEGNLSTLQQGQAVLAQRAALVEEFRTALGAAPDAIFDWDAMRFRGDDAGEK